MHNLNVRGSYFFFTSLNESGGGCDAYLKQSNMSKNMNVLRAGCNIASGKMEIPHIPWTSTYRVTS